MINADDNFKLKQVIELIATYFQRRNIDARMLQYDKVENASGGSLRQEATIRDGIDQETARHIVKEVKENTKLELKKQHQGMDNFRKYLEEDKEIGKYLFYTILREVNKGN